jgi:branched-chain amino acid transport system permease protein
VRAAANVSEPRVAAGRARAGTLAASSAVAGAVAAGCCCCHLLLPNAYFYEVAILVALNAMVCVGLNLLIGYAGQISLGHAGFYALGAYGSAILSAQHGWPAWLSMPVAVAAVGLLACSSAARRCG